MDVSRTGRIRMHRLSPLFLLAVLSTACSTDPNKRVDAVEDLVPAGVTLALRVESLSDVHAAVEFDSIAAAFPTIVSRIGQSLTHQLGFDLSDLHAARSAGVEPDAPLMVAFLKEPAGATVLVLPGDGQQIADHLREAYARRDGSPPTSSTYAGIPLLDASKSNTTILTFSEYVVVHAGVLRPDTRRRACEALIDGAGKTTLGDVSAYTAAQARVDGHITFFRSPHPDAPDGNEWLAKTPLGRWNAPLIGYPLGLGARHDGAAAGVRFSPTGVHVTTTTRLVDVASPLPEAAASRVFLDALPAAPKAAFNAFTSGTAFLDWIFPASAGTSPPALLAFLENPEGPARLLLNEVEGNLGVLVSELRLFGSDVVAYGEVSDAARAGATLDRVVASLKADPLRLPLGGTTEKIAADRVGDVPFYRLSMFPVAELCVGVVRGHLVATSTRQRFNAIVEGGPSFLERVREASYGQAIASGALATLYVDVPATADILSGLSSPLARRLSLLSAFDTAFLETSLDGTVLDGTWIVRSDTPGIWVELLRSAMGAHAG